MLKLTAVLLMLIDHIGASLYPEIFWLRLIGRLSFPIFAFLIAQGAKKTRDISKYQNRLLIFSIVSQPPFVYFSRRVSLTTVGNLEFILKSYIPNIDMLTEYSLQGHPGFNVGFTFLFALISIRLLKTVYGENGSSNSGSNILAPLFIFLLMAFSIIVNTDYSAYGIAMVIIFYVTDIYNNKIFLRLLGILLFLLNPFSMIIQSLTIFSVLIIRKIKDKKPFILPKFFFYGFYPIHLLILGYIMRL